MEWKEAMCQMEGAMLPTSGMLSLLFVGRSGLVIMSVGWWEMVDQHCFGQMSGLVEWLLGTS